MLTKESPAMIGNGSQPIPMRDMHLLAGIMMVCEVVVLPASVVHYSKSDLCASNVQSLHAR